MLKNLFAFLFAPEIKRKGVELEDYIEMIDSGKWHNKLFFGISKKYGSFVVVDPVKQPGGAYIGGMGSGKSVAMRTTMATVLATNSDNTVLIAIDPFKSMTDYTQLWKYPTVIKCLGQEEKFITVMDMLWSECMKRKAAFQKLGAKNIDDYDQITGKKLARILVFCEEFHSIMSSKILDYHNKVEKEGSAAWQLKNIMRIARSYGITLYLATQRATYDDIASSIKPGITQWCAFKVNNAGDAQAANLPQAADIPSRLRGRCATEDGWVQFPFIEHNIHDLVDPRLKPFEGELLSYSLDDFRKAMEADGNSGMLWVKPVSFAVSNFHQFDPKDVAKRILSIFDFKCSPQTNPSLVADLIAEKDGETYAVVLHKREQGFGRDDDRKNEDALKDSLPVLGIQKVISMSFGSEDPMKDLISETGGYSVGQEELKRIGEVVDGKSSFDDQDQFQSLFDKLVLAKAPYPTPVPGESSEDSEDAEDGPQMMDEHEEKVAALKRKFAARKKIIIE